MTKRKFFKWILTDCKGNVIAEGRKKDVANVSYIRYVYQHIFNDCLSRTNETLWGGCNKMNNIVYFLSNGEIFKYGETSRTAEIRAKEETKKQKLTKPLKVLGFVEFDNTNKSIRKWIEKCIEFELLNKGYKPIANKEDYTIKHYKGKCIKETTYLTTCLNIIKEYANFKNLNYKITIM